jgi:hypothetical protein
MREERRDRWTMATIKEETLVDKKGHRVGTIVLRMRQETKLYGTLSVDVKEVEMDGSVVPDVNSAKCAIKLVSQVHETPSTEAIREGGKVRFTWASNPNPNQFDINETNHVYDVFIMLMKCEPGAVCQGAPSTSAASTTEAGTAATDIAPKDHKKEEAKDEVSYPSLIGEARLSLFDARRGIQDPLPLFTNNQKQVGQVKVQVNLTETEKDGKRKKSPRDTAVEPK